MQRFLSIMTVLIGLGLSNPAFTSQVQQTGHIVEFSVSATESVANNTIVVTFISQAQADSSGEVISQINAQMRSAHRVLRHEDEVQYETGSYSVNPVYHNRKIEAWRGRQNLTIKTHDTQSIDKLLQKIQPHLQYQSMQFQVSKELKEARTELLIQKAITKFRQRASQVAQSFNVRSYAIIETKITTSGEARPYHAGLRMESAMAADSTAPVVVAGESDIKVFVSGKLRLPN